MNQLHERDFFFCYNPKLSIHLGNRGIRYIFKAKSIKDDKIFTLYKRSKQLQHAIDSYKKIQK